MTGGFAGSRPSRRAKILPSLSTLMAQPASLAQRTKRSRPWRSRSVSAMRQTPPFSVPPILASSIRLDHKRSESMRRLGRSAGFMWTPWQVMLFRTASVSLAHDHERFGRSKLRPGEARGPETYDAPLQRGVYSARSGAPPASDPRVPPDELDHPPEHI